MRFVAFVLFVLFCKRVVRREAVIIKQMELRELRSECQQLGCPGWRKWTELKLRRFKRRRECVKREKVEHSLDLETCEPLTPDQKRFVWPCKGHQFVFEPTQLMRHFLTSGEFSNPLTRAHISDRLLRRLVHKCED